MVDCALFYNLILTRWSIGASLPIDHSSPLQGAINPPHFRTPPPEIRVGCLKEKWGIVVGIRPP